MFYVTSELFARAALWTSEPQRNRFIISCAHSWNSFVLGDLWTLSDSLLVLTFLFTVFETIIQTTNPRFSTYWHTALGVFQRFRGFCGSEFRHLIYTYSILLLTQAGPWLPSFPSLLPFLPQPERLNSRRNPHWATNFPPKLILPSLLLSLTLWFSIALLNPPLLFLQILSPFHQVPYGNFFSWLHDLF